MMRAWRDGWRGVGLVALDCAGEPKCKAYTFVKPAQGKPGRCRLKDRAPARVPGDCCTSGVKK